MSVSSVLRAVALDVEQHALLELTQRSAVVLGRCNPVRVAVQAVATGSQRSRLPRAVTAAIAAALVHVKRLQKLRGVATSRVIGSTLSIGSGALAGGGGAAAAPTAAAAAGSFLTRFPRHAAIVAASVAADQLIRHHVMPRLAEIQESVSTAQKATAELTATEQLAACERARAALGELDPGDAGPRLAEFPRIVAAVGATRVGCDRRVLTVEHGQVPTVVVPSMAL